MCIMLHWGTSVCRGDNIMASCHLVWMDDASPGEAGVPRCSHHSLLRWRGVSEAACRRPPSEERIPLRSPGASRALRSVWRGPWKTIIAAMHHCFPLSVPLSHLPTFVFAFCLFPPRCLSSISSPFNCLCLLLSPSMFCSGSALPLLPTLRFLLVSLFARSLLTLSSYPFLLHHFLHVSGGKKPRAALKSNLHYPTPSFHPLITHSAPLA